MGEVPFAYLLCLAEHPPFYEGGTIRDRIYGAGHGTLYTGKIKIDNILLLGGIHQDWKFQWLREHRRGIKIPE